MITDSAKEFVQGKFGAEVRKTGTTLSHVEAHTPRLNYIEMRMGHLKQKNKGAMRKKNTPVRLWDDCAILQADIMSLTFQPGRLWNESRVPTSMIYGDTQDISPYVEFEWYQPVWAWCPKQSSTDHRVMARWLRPTTDFGMMLTYKLITEKASFVHRSSVQPVTEEELRQDEIQERIRNMDNKIKDMLNCPTQNELEAEDYDESGTHYYDSLPVYESYEDDTERTSQQPEADDVHWEEFDRYLSTEVVLPHGLLQQ